MLSPLYDAAMRLNTVHYRRIIRAVEIVCSVVSFSCIYSLENLSVSSQIENNGIIMAACFVFTTGVLIGDFCGISRRIQDSWILFEFALDFTFIVLSMGGSVTTIAKCIQQEQEGIPFCDVQSPYIYQPRTAWLGAIFGLVTCCALCVSLTIDYNKWLQTHVKYDDYEEG
mmetsp:Transcript_24990/g.34880  ORF Transcript_24990/g.34880 Transcript_24990/m.34880 type:complete len:170 (+) Transcript_24990:96-605(+)